MGFCDVIIKSMTPDPTPPIPDFSRRAAFPGTAGNPFDTVLRRMEQFESALPAPVFALILLIWAAVLRFSSLMSDPLNVLDLALFFFLDWALLFSLPRSNRSFGPARATTLLLMLMRTPFALLPAPYSTLAQTAGSLLVIYAFWVEPHRIRVTRQELISEKLSADAPPLRILHLSDLHVERITAREEQLTALINELKPDVILFSGDILNLSYLHDPTAQAAAHQVMSAWRAPGGVFAVSGSPAVDLPELFPKLVAGLPLHWLNDEAITLRQHGQKIQLIGLTCTHKPFVDAPRLETLTAPLDDSLFTVLLYHSPDLAPQAAQLSTIDLQLSGHTHGGQVRLPLIGALFTGSLYGRRFQAGKYILPPGPKARASFKLYISRGIGMEGKGAPRVRFLCPPEIILWELKGKKHD